ncbi:MAG: exodeoxyribonuclease VII small subunit [Saprospiraceae bacterium]|nr:exodeoxyribonuclease VII small subunit [Saprospiraceae bacterium]HMW40143.1 exodeoxyribonuclease VII small subunit [Saprospiraceae bacterium]HMX87194.1 exodeoxyribonuclease VII small subunit [Saprospiraceae bacterium]HMZ38726.1 exodeoxyribonuclease VII small subunit [Saprospiraceae bacterium]HNA64708.1 exodeoxyribonuclease VII small subunit [Saprospiraceae bacterium]
MKKQKMTYEESMQRLEQIIDQIQKDQTTMSELTQVLQEARELIKFCEDSLRNVQDKLTEFNDEP